MNTSNLLLSRPPREADEKSSARWKTDYRGSLELGYLLAVSTNISTLKLQLIFCIGWCAALKNLAPECMLYVMTSHLKHSHLILLLIVGHDSKLESLFQTVFHVSLTDMKDKTLSTYMIRLTPMLL